MKNFKNISIVLVLFVKNSFCPSIIRKNYIGKEFIYGFEQVINPANGNVSKKWRWNKLCI